MIYKEVSKVHKGVIRTLWLIAALSLVLSYAVMCIAWLSKGCRYGAQFCINVFMRALPLCLIFLCIVELAGLFIWVFKIKKLERLYAKKGGCDEYFELLEKYLLRQNKDKGHGLLKLAAVYISEKRFENCFLTLDRIAFDKLTPSDQNKYFELLLTAVSCQVIFLRQTRYLFRQSITSSEVFSINAMGKCFSPLVCWNISTNALKRR